jgi:sterol 24-C-methyltransferase
MGDMSSSPLEREDHGRDAAFSKALHSNSSQTRGGVWSMLSKNNQAQTTAIDEYFKHWDGKTAFAETDKVRKVLRDLAHSKKNLN